MTLVANKLDQPLSKNENLTTLRKRIQNYLKNIRKKSKESFLSESLSLTSPVFTESRKTLFEKTLVDRLVIFLRGSGCFWVEQGGGCTFCGFYNATNFGNQIDDSDYLQQVQFAIDEKKHTIANFPIISLYNDGSMLSEKEIRFSAFLKILEKLNKISSLKKITIESRIGDITTEKIRTITKSTNKKIEVAFGFESANPLIRKICVNKNFTNSKVIKVCEILKNFHVDIVPLMMIKPPFLTEREAIDDALKSIDFLNSLGVYRIDIELPTVEKFTLTEKLHEKFLYEPLMLWSVVKILEENANKENKTPLYISPPRYTVPSIAMSSNCASCDNLFYNLFDEYNKTGDTKNINWSNFETCNCKKKWTGLINENSSIDFLERAKNYMEILEK